MSSLLTNLQKLKHFDPSTHYLTGEGKMIKKRKCGSFQIGIIKFTNLFKSCCGSPVEVKLKDVALKLSKIYNESCLTETAKGQLKNLAIKLNTHASNSQRYSSQNKEEVSSILQSLISPEQSNESVLVEKTRTTKQFSQPPVAPEVINAKNQSRAKDLYEIRHKVTKGSINYKWNQQKFFLQKLLPQEDKDFFSKQNDMLVAYLTKADKFALKNTGTSDQYKTACFEKLKELKQRLDNILKEQTLLNTEVNELIEKQRKVYEEYCLNFDRLFQKTHYQGKRNSTDEQIDELFELNNRIQSELLNIERVSMILLAKFLQYNNHLKNLVADIQQVKDNHYFILKQQESIDRHRKVRDGG